MDRHWQVNQHLRATRDTYSLARCVFTTVLITLRTVVLLMYTFEPSHILALFFTIAKSISYIFLCICILNYNPFGMDVFCSLCAKRKPESKDHVLRVCVCFLDTLKVTPTLILSTFQFPHFIQPSNKQCWAKERPASDGFPSVSAFRSRCRFCICF